MTQIITSATVTCLILIGLLTSCTADTTEEETASAEETSQPEGESTTEKQTVDEEVTTGGTDEEEQVETEVSGETGEPEEPEEEMTIPPNMPRGTEDPHIAVDIYNADEAYNGTTLFADNHDPEKPRIIEVNMLGEIIWEYQIPQNLKEYTNPGFDTEMLPNDNILFVLPRRGVYEVNRQGEIVWSYLTDKISHDADRLPNGNTIFVFGAFDQKNDSQVTEVNEAGEVVWTWHARNDFDVSPYSAISNEGWTHTNSVTRMVNGNTLISPRNFCRLIEVDAEGKLVRTIGDGVIFSDKGNMLNAYDNPDPFSPHDPEVLPNGNILMVSQYNPMRAIEMVPETGEIVWEYAISDRMNFPVRDADRLPNGNTLITGAIKLTEVTPEGKIVWQLRLKNVTIPKGEGSSLGFYKAERTGL